MQLTIEERENAMGREKKEVRKTFGLAIDSGRGGHWSSPLNPNRLPPLNPSRITTQGPYQ